MGGGFDGIDAGLVLMGGFYAFAGVVSARAGVMSAFLDQAIAQISLKPTPKVERQRFWWLTGSSVLVFLGGVTLMVRAGPALWLFLLSAAGQAFYVYVLGPRYFDRADPPDVRGRSQTMTAFYIYLVATALVVLAASAGRLRGFPDLSSFEVASGLLLIAGFAILLARWLRPRPGDRGET